MEPMQVMADPSSPYTPMVPAAPVSPVAPAPVSPVAPAPVSPVAPAPVPVVQTPAQPSYNNYFDGLAAPADQASAPMKFFEPMPKECKDYSTPECQVFLDWPTGVMCMLDSFS